MNCYAGLVDIKSRLGISNTDSDAILLDCLLSSSKIIDNYCNRHFYVESGTRYFDGAVPLWIDDLLSITTLTTDEDGDATFENTFATTDYILYPLNTFPKTKIELTADGDYGTFGYSKKGCSIAGKWGYGESATPYTTSGGTVTVADGTSTSVTASDGTLFSAGQTILAGTEQMYISSISSNTLTAIRGVNGTTGAAQSTATAYIYDYPADIEQACMSLAEKMFATRGKAFQSERLGDYSYTMSKEEPVKALLSRYRKVKA